MTYSRLMPAAAAIIAASMLAVAGCAPTPEEQAKMEQELAQYRAQLLEKRFADYRQDMADARKECRDNWNAGQNDTYPWKTVYKTWWQCVDETYAGHPAFG